MKISQHMTIKLSSDLKIVTALT